MGHIVGDSSHHGVIDQNGYLIGLGSGCIAGDCRRSQSVDGRLHGDLANAHDRHLEAHGKTDFQMGDKIRADAVKIRPVEPQYFKGT